MRQIADRRVLRRRPSDGPPECPLLRSEVCAGEMKNGGLVWAHDDGITVFFLSSGGVRTRNYDQEPVRIAEEGKMPWDVMGNEFEWSICQQPHNQH